MSTIERVELAIKKACEEAEREADEYCSPLMAKAAARAAIEALREPTQDMTFKGLVGLVDRIKEIIGPSHPRADGQVLSDRELANRYMDLGAKMRNGSEVDACWRAMIDSILAEGQ